MKVIIQSNGLVMVKHQLIRRNTLRLGFCGFQIDTFVTALSRTSLEIPLKVLEEMSPGTSPGIFDVIDYVH